MQLIPLSLETQAATGFTHKVHIDLADLQALTSGSAAAILPLSGTIPAGTVVTRVAYNLITALDGGSSSTGTLSIGDDGSATRWINAAVIHVDGTEVFYGVSATAYVYLAANTVDIVVTITGDTCANLTQGELEIYLAVANLNNLEND